MKVHAWKTIDVEVEVDVTIDDLINECMDIAHSQDEWRRKLTAIDGATRILQRVSPDVVRRISGGDEAVVKAMAMIRDRLKDWIEFLG